MLPTVLKGATYCTDSPDRDDQTSHMPSALSREQRLPARRDSDADDQARRPFSAHLTRCSPLLPLLKDGRPQLPSYDGGQMA